VTYRHLFDLADWDRGLATGAPGLLGQPASPHYADLLPLWGRGAVGAAAAQQRWQRAQRHGLASSIRACQIG
jgi:hypothetical protein